ncbi:PfkB family carbohydrate kinase [Methylophaga sp. SB9B]|uniref:PfkB family carbohydrate kinase n=1 Tax=Methylophaga sp. SB9B TaxID=2570356 RepID=UPI001FFE5B29|nr:PfkB family carbohydrate kinase [Methylophaga sp. SB9B]
MPTSYITLNRQNGSRTIVHHRDCPELSFDAFRQIDLTQFDWLHFEGRNITELAKILKHCRQNSPNVPISLEIEKPRDSIESLFDMADWLFFSRAYAEAKGYRLAEDLFDAVCHAHSATCTWGAEGAYGLHNAQMIFCPATKIPKAVDSLGAGDTFNAGMIHSLLAKKSLNDSLQFASQLAARKCQQYGFENLVKSL